MGGGASRHQKFVAPTYRPPDEDVDDDDFDDSAYLCPITQEIMRDPVMAADGHSYDRAAIEEWLQTHDTSPLTNYTLQSKLLTPNHALRSIIDERCNKSRQTSGRSEEQSGRAAPSTAPSTRRVDRTRAPALQAAAANEARASGATSTAAASGGKLAVNLARLLDMGFERSDAEAALVSTDGNMLAALARLGNPSSEGQGQRGTAVADGPRQHASQHAQPAGSSSEKHETIGPSEEDEKFEKFMQWIERDEGRRALLPILRRGVSGQTQRTGRPQNAGGDAAVRAMFEAMRAQGDGRPAGPWHVGDDE